MNAELLNLNTRKPRQAIEILAREALRGRFTQDGV